MDAGSAVDVGGWHSVQERASWCTEYAFGAKKGLLVYATYFLRHSVQKTGFWCTEGKFGAGNPLLWYATCSSGACRPGTRLEKLGFLAVTGKTRPGTRENGPVSREYG